jgi:hypothetical protein
VTKSLIQAKDLPATFSTFCSDSIFKAPPGAAFFSELGLSKGFSFIGL